MLVLLGVDMIVPSFEVWLERPFAWIFYTLVHRPSQSRTLNRSHSHQGLTAYSFTFG